MAEDKSKNTTQEPLPTSAPAPGSTTPATQGEDTPDLPTAFQELKTQTIDVVEAKIGEFAAAGEIHLPANYSAGNAMKSAWLILQETKDKNDKPVLRVCTRQSIANALLDMVVQGLNPEKKQCYFIAYGDQLACQRSYFGTMHVCKMVTGASNVYAQVVYVGDELDYEIVKGQRVITGHRQKLDDVQGDKIVAAYCIVEWPDGRTVMELMTFDQIKQAWKMSKMKPVDDSGKVKPDSTHGKFPVDMSLKTVINHTCKPLINASDDSRLLEAYRHSDDFAQEAALEAEILEEANGEVLEIPATVETTAHPACEEGAATGTCPETCPKDCAPEPCTDDCQDCEHDGHCGDQLARAGADPVTGEITDGPVDGPQETLV